MNLLSAFSIKSAGAVVKPLLLTASMAVTATFAVDLPDFTELIKKSAPTVVQIDAVSHGSQTRQGLNENATPEDLLRYFFEGQGGFPSIQPRFARPSASHGSGFFIDDEGYILTNAHVVDDADEITVSTTDQTEYKAELIGMDERTDVALLKVKKEGVPSAKIGNSDDVEVGNWVLAIGSPFGFDYTATKGIVSAVSRSLPDGTYVPFIQTDAAVNPGNSGGPLFNLKGEVIGINSQIYSRTGSFNGLAFAIPINTAMNIVKQIKDKGFVSRGWLGVAIQTVDQDLAESFGLDKPKGALVSSVIENSPAEEAGIEAGDIILSFNDKPIKKSSELPPMVGTVEVGKKVPVELLRHGRKRTVKVTIGELDEDNGQKLSKKSGKVSYQGIKVADLTDEQKDKLEVEQGAYVTKVEKTSNAARAGLRRGDVIVNVNNQPIKGVKAFKRAMKSIDGNKPVAVLIVRQGRSLFIAL